MNSLNLRWTMSILKKQNRNSIFHGAEHWRLVLSPALKTHDNQDVLNASFGVMHVYKKI